LAPAMAKKICIYCQERPGTTRDHVFPLAWYPTTTPATVQRRTVPCCPECNHRLHLAEDAVGLDLISICNPGLREMAGVQESMTRAWKPDRARPGEDRKHRSGKPLKMLRTMEWVPPHSGAPIVYVQKNGVIRPASPARTIDKDAMRVVVEKFVRGLHYIETNAILAAPGPHPPDANPLLPLDMRFHHAILPNHFVQMVNPRLTVESFDPTLIAAVNATPVFAMFGPGFLYRRLRTRQGAATWMFLLWGQLEVVGFAMPRVLAAKVENAEGL